MNHYVAHLTEELSLITSRIVSDSPCETIFTLQDLRFFMEQHVFAVWDFMCLLKELYRRIVCTSPPWFPPKDSLGAHLINGILTEEESDIAEDGCSYASHYDTYLTAMKQIGANTTSIKKLLVLLKNGIPIANALELIQIRAATKKFVLTTFSFFECSTHELAAAFVYGREGVTAPLFLPLLNRLENDFSAEEKPHVTTLMYYLKRHIELDNDEHFPKAIQMLCNLVGNDEKKWKEVEMAAKKALTARADFFNDIRQGINKKTPSVKNAIHCH